MTNRADSVRVAYPLFQAEGGGSIPTSALSLRFHRVDRRTVETLNREWHSRLPLFRTAAPCEAYYGAMYEDVWYAIAAWSHPISRMLPQSWMELRRFAIADDAPKNTASRMLGWMIRDIRRRFPKCERLLSYQDTAVHTGTIYRAVGWTPIATYGCTDWTQTSKRVRNTPQTTAIKVRWELPLTRSAESG